jgi:uncharacterized protein YjbI with pentapeptide repeats
VSRARPGRLNNTLILTMSNWDLKKRWKKNELEKIIQFVQRGGFFTHKLSPFGLLKEGHIDLRGLLIEGSILKNIEFDNIDFSFSSFKSAWIEKVNFSDCIFSNVNFSNFADHDNKFENCSFLDCKFNNAVIGYKDRDFKNVPSQVVVYKEHNLSDLNLKWLIFLIVKSGMSILMPHLLKTVFLKGCLTTYGLGEVSLWFHMRLHSVCQKET